MGDCSEHAQLDRLAHEFVKRLRQGNAPSIEDLADQHPEHADEIRDLFPMIWDFEEARSALAEREAASLELPPLLADNDQQLGRYTVRRQIGGGGFGKVYLGWDEQLQREVAIKLPHHQPRGGATSNQFANLIREARLAAAVDHPGIVPVYDLGDAPDGRCYFVTRYIDGESLADRLRSRRPRVTDAIRMVTEIAHALHAAHQRGLVHRDVKPGNILVDKNGRSYITDFGIALAKDDSMLELSDAGTPRYMSPEQARRQTHRIDARSDVYSLGVVLYELLTGSTPYSANSTVELLEKIARADVSPPRKLNPRIPESIQQVCLKAMSRRRCDRYQTARAMADELEAHARARHDPSLRALNDLSRRQAGSAEQFRHPGLMPFQRSDATTLLHLLPGPYDKQHVPDSVRFWKHRIGPRAADGPMPIGVLLGPTGVGKSSFVHAGILPLLDSKLVTLSVTVSSSAEDLSGQVLELLRTCYAELPQRTTLPQFLDEIEASSDDVLLLVVDQFERFFDACAPGDPAWEKVVAMLSQCDGRRIQSLLVTDDRCWYPLSRLFHQLGTTLQIGSNLQHMEPLEVRYARQVLMAMGRASGQVAAQTSVHMASRFIDGAVESLRESNAGVLPIVLTMFHTAATKVDWTVQNFSCHHFDEIGANYLDWQASKLQTPDECELDAVAGLLPISEQQRARIPTLAAIRSVLTLFGALRDSDQGATVGDIVQRSEMEWDEAIEVLRILEKRWHLLKRLPVESVDSQAWNTPEACLQTANLVPAHRSQEARFQIIAPCIQRWVQHWTHTSSVADATSTAKNDSIMKQWLSLLARWF